MITGFAHVGIRVHDLARSRAFYELLGWDFIAGPIGPEPVALMHHPSGIEINLVLNAPDAKVPNPLMDVPHKLPGYTHISVFVDDLDAVAALLEAGGFPITQRVNFPDGVKAAFVRDPDGNVLEFDQKSA